MRRLHFVVLFALVVGLVFMLPPATSAQIAVGVSVHIGPPPLRVVAVQPDCPGPGYLWTPGYWAYGPDGYYWVPGAWVVPPQPGLLWTPGYWGWGDGVYVWHRGYWGPHVGFYGGINYGFGYFGTGFVGGRWDHDRFFYNSAVWHVDEHVVRNVYVDRTVVRNVYVNRVSYNGGRGGIDARPSRDDDRWEHERHWDATPVQARHEDTFRGNRASYHSFQPPNRGEHGDMGRGNDRGNRGNQGFDRGRGNDGMNRGNDRGNRGNQGMDRGNQGRGNDRGNQGMDRGNQGRGNDRGNQGMDRGNQGRGNDRGNRGGDRMNNQGHGQGGGNKGQGKPHDEGKPHGRG